MARAPSRTLRAISTAMPCVWSNVTRFPRLTVFPTTRFPHPFTAHGKRKQVTGESARPECNPAREVGAFGIAAGCPTRIRHATPRLEGSCFAFASSVKAKKIQPDVPDPARFPIIQEAWRRLLTGTYRKIDLHRFFQNHGLTTREGRPIRPQLIDWIFNNKYYAGILTEPWSRAEYQGRHEPMITPEEFAQAQHTLNPRRNSTPHLQANADFPLRSLLRCPSCGGYLTASWSRGRGGRYAYYWCRRRPCARYGKGFRREELHRYFEQLLTGVAPKSTRLPDLEARTLAVLTQLQTNETARSERTRRRIRSLEQENQHLIVMRRRELIDDHEFLRSHGRLSNQIQALKAGMANGSTSAVDAGQIREAFAFLADLPSFWPQLDLDLQTRFNRVLFPEGVVVGDGRTPTLGPLFSFIDASGSASSCEVRPSGVEPETLSLKGTCSTS